jgi:Ni/Fe-hydrogenase subunit HybB-like protein
VLLATSWFVTYGYLAETFMAYYSGDQFDIYMIRNRMAGPYAPIYWALIACNVLAPQIVWWRAARRCVPVLFTLSIVVNMGMWMERFLIVVSSLHRDFLPSSWGMFYPTAWDWTHLLGSIGSFAVLFMLFVRFLPVISISEIREMLHEQKLRGGAA